MSADLQWQVIRNRSSFLFKNRTGARAQFSTEALNVSKKNSFAANGLVNKKAVGVAPAADGGVIISFKNKRAGNAPGKAIRSVKLTKGGRRTTRAVKSLTKNYRGDLTHAAAAAANAVLASQKSKTAKVRRGRKTATQ
eukprot:m.14673 g.14673  ORF g.14673 m.14673 type:complete len:138 (-) comp4872_c0_seq1:54-467(-)